MKKIQKDRICYICID